MKRILFPTAHSENARTIWLYTLKLAHYFEASITLMHVYQGKRISTADDFVTDDFDEVIQQFEQEVLATEKDRIHQFAQDQTPKRYQSISFRYVVALGDVQEAILEELRENSYDLLVLGTSTKSSSVKRLFGGTTLSLIHQSTVPLFLVPPSDTSAMIDKIVYLTDLEADQVSTIQRLMQWVQIFDAQLHILHIYKRTMAAQQAYSKMEKLRRIFEEEYQLGSITCQLLEGHFVESVQMYLQYIQADMLVMANHRQGIFAQLFDPDHTYQLVHATRSPMLILRQNRK